MKWPWTHDDLTSASGEVEVHAAAFVVALLRNDMVDEAASFWEWYQENIGDSQRIESLLEAEGFE